MYKALLIAVVLVLCVSYAPAQNHPPVELSAGWNYLHFDTGAGTGGASESSTDGFYIDGTYYFNDNVGITADFQWNKKTFPAGTITGAGGPTADTSSWGLAFGLRSKWHLGRLEPFGHGLFGFNKLSVTPQGSATESDTAFAMKIGGGVDVAVVKHFAIRAGEVNYYMTRYGNAGNPDIHLNGKGTQNNFTISAGIVLR